MSNCQSPLQPDCKQRAAVAQAASEQQQPTASDWDVGWDDAFDMPSDSESADAAESVHGSGTATASGQQTPSTSSPHGTKSISAVVQMGSSTGMQMGRSADVQIRGSAAGRAGSSAEAQMGSSIGVQMRDSTQAQRGSNAGVQDGSSAAEQTASSIAAAPSTHPAPAACLPQGGRPSSAQRVKAVIDDSSADAPATPPSHGTGPHRQSHKPGIRSAHASCSCYGSNPSVHICVRYLVYPSLSTGSGQIRK